MPATKVRPHPYRTAVVVALGALGALLLAVALLLWLRGTEGTILGQAEWPFGRRAYATASQTPRLVVVRSEGDFHQATGWPGDGKSRPAIEAFLTKAFGVKKVPFNRQMLVVVAGGVQPTDGFRVEVTKVEPDKEAGVLRVYWKLHAPEPGQPVAQTISYPAAVVLLKRFDGEVKLEPAEGAKPTSALPREP